MLAILFPVLMFFTQPAATPPPALPAPLSPPSLYEACGLQDVLPKLVFQAAYARALERDPQAAVLAIADLSRPSTEQRLYVVDLRRRALLLRTWVAHGQNSGALQCEVVSDRPGSLCSSAGLYRVGTRIASPKHGDALLLDGLDPGQNGRAREREIIIHAAAYVSSSFIAAHGRLGRSWGCPAVSAEAMPQLLALLPPGSLLYVNA
jgi:hypothetical protein